MNISTSQNEIFSHCHESKGRLFMLTWLCLEDKFWVGNESCGLHDFLIMNIFIVLAKGDA